MMNRSPMPGTSSSRRRGSAGRASSAVVAKDIAGLPRNTRQRADQGGEHERAGRDHRPGIERQGERQERTARRLGVGRGHGPENLYGPTWIYLNRIFIPSTRN